MNLFAFLGRRKSPPGLLILDDILAEDADRLRAIRDFLEQTPLPLSDGAVCERADEHCVELRGTYRNRPARLRVFEFDGRVSLELKATGPKTGLRLELQRAESAREAADAWDDDDEVRAKVADGIELVCAASEKRSSMELLQAVPQAELATVYAGMRRLRLSDVSVWDDEIHLDLETPVHRLQAPEERLAEVIAFAEKTARTFEALRGRGAKPEQYVGSAFDAARLQCSFCTAVYLLTAAQVCPHCGAPPEA